MAAVVLAPLIVGSFAALGRFALSLAAVMVAAAGADLIQRRLETYEGSIDEAQELALQAYQDTATQFILSSAGQDEAAAQGFGDSLHGFGPQYLDQLDRTWSLVSHQARRGLILPPISTSITYMHPWMAAWAEMQDLGVAVSEQVAEASFLFEAAMLAAGAPKFNRGVGGTAAIQADYILLPINWSVLFETQFKADIAFRWNHGHIAGAAVRFLERQIVTKVTTDPDTGRLELRQEAIGTIVDTSVVGAPPGDTLQFGVITIPVVDWLAALQHLQIQGVVDLIPLEMLVHYMHGDLTFLQAQALIAAYEEQFFAGAWLQAITDVTGLFDPFADKAEADLWITRWSQLQAMGAMSLAQYLQGVDFWRSELDRLTAAGVISPNVANSVDALSASLAAQLGLLANTMPLALTNAAIQGANQSHQARIACQATGAVAILQRLAGLAGPAALPVALFGSDQGRALVEPLLATLFDYILDRTKLPADVTPDNAVAVAKQLFLDKSTLAATSHLIAMAVEANTSLKHMGAGYLAALITDFAGFQRLAQGTLGQVEWAALTRPMGQWANREFRTEIPRGPQLDLLYAKKEIPTSLYRDYLQRQGYTDALIADLESAVFEDPRLTEIIHIGQFFNPVLNPEVAAPNAAARDYFARNTEWLVQIRPAWADVNVAIQEMGTDWYVYYRMLKSGYDIADVQVLVEVTRRAVARRDQTLALDAITRLFRDGFIDLDEVERRTFIAWASTGHPRATAEEARQFTNPVTARVVATQWRAEYDDKVDERDVYLQAMVRGLLTPAQAEANLLTMGMRPEKVRLEVLRRRLGLLPRSRITLEDVELELPVEGL